MEDAVIDLFLLSKCKELHISEGSSFGLFAAHMGNIRARFAGLPRVFEKYDSYEWSTNRQRNI